MMKNLLVVLLLLLSVNQAQEKVSIRNECSEFLPVLTNALLLLQNTDVQDANFGGLFCPNCKLYHSRAAEAVYPLAVVGSNTNNTLTCSAAVKLGNWLIRQQEKTGEWLETPWTWTGTTADQLLMMSLAFPKLEKFMSEKERSSWKESIKKAADYLVKTMNPDFATINYCATTPACLSTTFKIIPDSGYLKKARMLSRMVLSKINTDGFIEGEAARIGVVKYGTDVGYEFDMSFWGLGLYAKLTGDTLIFNRVLSAVKSHLEFVYPNGMIDGSWGTRCYKWTTFGSKTADGCQILFSLFASNDKRFRTAAILNLRYLRTMVKDGMIGNGPHFFRMNRENPCIYPTFARAKNLALAIELGEQKSGNTGQLPTEVPGTLTFYKTMNVAVARTQKFAATISGHRYIDIFNWGQGRYSQFPSGGAICNLYVDGFGLLQTSSPTKYIRGEVVHMPEIKETIQPLTSRIEYSDSGALYTNLYHRNTIITTERYGKTGAHISASGEMANESHLPGGVGYTLDYRIGDESIEKSVHIVYHDKFPEISIVEPFILHDGFQIEKISGKKVKLIYPNSCFLLEVVAGDVVLETGKNKEQFWQPFPAVECYPIVLKIAAPVQPFEQENYFRDVTYKLTLLK